MTLRRGLAFTAALLAVASSGGASGPAAPSLLGQTAPGFRLKDLEGRTVSLDGLRGRLVVLHFGASW